MSHADRMSDPDVRLKQAVIAALSRSVQKQNYGPFPVGVEIGGNKNLVPVSGCLRRNCAVQETGLYLARRRRTRVN